MCDYVRYASIQDTMSADNSMLTARIVLQNSSAQTDTVNLQYLTSILIQYTNVFYLDSGAGSSGRIAGRAAQRRHCIEEYSNRPTS